MEEQNRSIDFATFKKAEEDKIAKNDTSWNNLYNQRFVKPIKDYSLEEVEQIINSSSLLEQQKLSRNYYDKNGFYKRILLYYATLLTYAGLLIPNPSFGKQLSNSHIGKRYHGALEYVDKINIASNCTRMSLKALISGSYYGVIQEFNRDKLVIFDLPNDFCCSRFKDIEGNDIVEFDVKYFDTILSEKSRKDALSVYPKVVVDHYAKYHKGRTSNSWVSLPSDTGICFTFFDDGRPLFLDIIPATIHYDQAVIDERDRALEEIHKIIVQKIPRTNDGTLIFEPDEAAVMHSGAVGMMKNNRNISVLTTYADVDAITSKASSEAASSTLERMLGSIYSTAGVSPQIFSPTGSQALPTSLNNDLSLMMVLANKYSHFFTSIVNSLFSNAAISFTYKILPISLYNTSDYIKDYLKLAQSGYSFLLPAIAGGLNQRELSSVKVLENDVLKLRELLIPLSSSYTQSSGEPGAPEKTAEEKSEKTIRNEEALNNQGDSVNG